MLLTGHLNPWHLPDNERQHWKQPGQLLGDFLSQRDGSQRRPLTAAFVLPLRRIEIYLGLRSAELGNLCAVIG